MKKKYYYRLAGGLAVLTIACYLIQLLEIVYWGDSSQSLTLFCFGLAIFVGVISALGIVRYVISEQHLLVDESRGVERTALRFTGYAFYSLIIGLLVTAGYSLWIVGEPVTSHNRLIVWFSILLMTLFSYAKNKVGKKIKSVAILADIACSNLCVCMLALMVLSSSLYRLAQIPYVYAISSLVLTYYAFKKGKQCFKQSNSNE